MVNPLAVDEAREKQAGRTVGARKGEGGMQSQVELKSHTGPPPFFGRKNRKKRGFIVLGESLFWTGVAFFPLLTLL